MSAGSASIMIDGRSAEAWAMLQNGEAMARIVNCTGNKVIITKGCPIGQINVLRIKMNTKDNGVPRVSDKALMSSAN